MTDQTSSKLSEFTWYSRLAAWIGAAMLLVQSVLGRDAGPVTILAVLLLGVGFLCFLFGLAVDSRLPGATLLVGPGLITGTDSDVARPLPRSTPRAPTSNEPADLEAAAGHVIPPADEPVGREKRQPKPSAPAAAPSPAVQGPGRRPKFRERARKTDVRPEPRSETVPAPPPPQDAPIRPAAARVESPPVGVATELLGPGNIGVGAECPRCANALRLGQLATTCPVCGRTHHAVCWMENHFHCGAPDCTGHGSLEAPTDLG